MYSDIDYLYFREFVSAELTKKARAAGHNVTIRATSADYGNSTVCSVLTFIIDLEGGTTFRPGLMIDTNQPGPGLLQSVDWVSGRIQQIFDGMRNSATKYYLMYNTEMLTQNSSGFRWRTPGS